MTTATTRILSISLAAFLLLPGCKQRENYSQEVLERIHKVENSLVIRGQEDSLPGNLQERMAFHKTQGLSIAVINNYEVEWSKAYGWADISEQRPVTTETRFQAASISKSLNALALLRLAHEQGLDLYANINQHLNSWKFPYDSLSQGQIITIPHLLSHTAGLGVHGFPGYAVGDSLPTLTDVLDGKAPANTAAVRAVFAPGIKYQYSGGGSSISQKIIEDVTQRDYAQFMWETALKPLGMRHSSYAQPSQIAPEFLATGYLRNDEEVAGKFHIYPEQAAAGLWTTPNDLAKFIIEMQKAYEGKSPKMLSQEMVRLMLSPFLDQDINGQGQFIGLGAFIEKKGKALYFQHSGSNEGFVCQYYGSLHTGKGLVIMTNANRSPVMRELIQSVAKVYNWEGF